MAVLWSLRAQNFICRTSLCSLFSNGRLYKKEAFIKRAIIFTVAQNKVEHRRFRGMAPFLGKTMTKQKVLHFEKKFH